MATTSKPTMQQLRQYLSARHASPQPPPSPEQVRRELRWELLPHNLKPQG